MGAMACVWLPAPEITKARIAENCIVELQKLPTLHPMDVYFIDDRAKYMDGACVGGPWAHECFRKYVAAPTL